MKWVVYVILVVMLLLVFAVADYDFTNAGTVVGMLLIIGVVLLIIRLVTRKKR